MRSMAMAAVVVLAGLDTTARADFRAFTPSTSGILTTTGPAGGESYSFALTTGDLVTSSAQTLATAAEVKYLILLPTGARIDSATFGFTVASSAASGGVPPTLAVTATTVDGNLAKESDFFGPIEAVGATGPIGATPATYRFDVTTQLLANAIFAGFFLSSSPGSVTTSGILSGVDLAPTLTITYHVVAPEPSSLVLCGLAGAIGLAVARSRSRR